MHTGICMTGSEVLSADPRRCGGCTTAQPGYVPHAPSTSTGPREGPGQNCDQTEAPWPLQLCLGNNILNSLASQSSKHLSIHITPQQINAGFGALSILSFFNPGQRVSPWGGTPGLKTEEKSERAGRNPWGLLKLWSLCWYLTHSLFSSQWPKHVRWPEPKPTRTDACLSHGRAGESHGNGQGGAVLLQGWGDDYFE